MNIKALESRSETRCELCANTEELSIYPIAPHTSEDADTSILVCGTCREQIKNPDKIDMHHWRCLNDSMWSQAPPVQVMAWRMLSRLSHEAWARDLLDMLYLEDDVLAWAKAEDTSDEDTASHIEHMDSNGAQLTAGDTVVLIKDLNVKGAGFTAKRGTAVRGISLVPDNAKHIEGRVNGQQIVILTEFVKKS